MHSKGQSTIELAIVFTLVILGIVVAGPYVIRSVNSHFKLWDESVHDSFYGKTIEARKDQVEINVPGCTCGDPLVGGCGLHGCAENEHLMLNKDCRPAGCLSDEFCLVHVPGVPDCCTTPLRTPICWRSSADAPRLGTIAPPGFATTCELGDRVFQYNCGSSAGMQVCQADHTAPNEDAFADRDCRPTCHQDFLPKDVNGNLIAHLCANSGTDLRDDLTTVLLAGACPSPSRPANCEAACDAGYHYSNNFCVKCGDGRVDPGESCDLGLNCRTDCSCPPGFKTNPSDQGCMPANYCTVITPKQATGNIASQTYRNFGRSPLGPPASECGGDFCVGGYGGQKSPPSPDESIYGIYGVNNATQICKTNGFGYSVNYTIAPPSSRANYGGDNDDWYYGSSGSLSPFYRCTGCWVINNVTCSNDSTSDCSGGTTNCNSGSCVISNPLSYRWVEQGNWNGCNASCGSPGIETQTVYCQSSAGTMATPADCVNAGVKPLDQRPCIYPCTYTYFWVADDNWQGCTATCGNGTQTQSVFCQRTAGVTGDIITVAPSWCESAGLPRPASTRSCSSNAGCANLYHWVGLDDWHGCTGTCASVGQEFQTVICQSSVGVTVDNNLCPGTAPDTRPCALPCSYSYNWQSNGDWGACNAACGQTGTQTQTTSCTRSDGHIEPDENCASVGPKPTVSRACTGACTYAWQGHGNWFGCTATCGTGQERQTVTCRRSDGVTVADTSLCSGPSPDTRTCTSFHACTFSWATDPWQDCSSSCGEPGSEFRRVYCKRSDGTEAATNSACANAGASPADNRACVSYDGCTYQWLLGDTWGECSGICGEGNRYKTLNCRRSDGQNVSSFLCPPSSPVNSERCVSYDLCCSDNIQDHGETGIDCGGSCVTCCGNGTIDPAANETCDSGAFCNSTTCACPTNYVPNGNKGCMGCGDRIVNNGEICDSGDSCFPNCTCPNAWIPDGDNGCKGCGDNTTDTSLGETCDPPTSACPVPAYRNPAAVCQYCTAACSLTTITGPSCGDSQLNGEICDGGASCANCSCPANWISDGNRGCKTCGNNLVDNGEVCDGGTGCINCSCPANWIPNGNKGCMGCGDNIRNNGEVCDGGPSCANCSCPVNWVNNGGNGCMGCGDSIRNNGEVCDGGPNCTNCFCPANWISDGTRGCKSCGNGLVDSGEICDGGTSCANCSCPANWISDGSRGCKSCGNALVDNGEVCDGGTSCANCSCPANWISDGARGCKGCGNGLLDNGEICDGGTSCANCSCPANWISDGSRGCLGCGDTVCNNGETCSTCASDCGGCTFSWSYGSWPNGCGWVSDTGCCRRSDGQCVSDGSCSGGRPTTYQTNTCGYSWSIGGWPSGCGLVSDTGCCRRSDGQCVSDGSCSGGRPTIYQTNACSYSWISGGCSTTCGGGTDTGWCRRSDGTSVDASLCGGTPSCNTQACQTCGDGIKNGTEQCDGSAGIGANQSCSATCTLINLPFCGDDECNNGETCSTCENDCGVCPPPPDLCGNNNCDNGETCSDCPTDCGVCASCNDVIQNQGEEGVDCGGPCHPCCTGGTEWGPYCHECLRGVDCNEDPVACSDPETSCVEWGPWIDCCFFPP